MHLRCELRGHEEDVRGICICPIGIVSTSRDKTVKIWKETDEDEFVLDKTLEGHEDFVVPVVWIPPGALPEFPDGTIATGSRDGHIIVWDVLNGIPALHLIGHTHQVTSLGVLSDGTLVSSSVDGTLRLWKNGTSVATLKEHEGSVVSLLVLPDDHILSGSIDKTMRLWKDGNCISTFTGHADTVRAMTLAPNLGVISGSHDKTLRLWSLNGECLTVYEGHSEIIYACAFSEKGFIASGSEDGTTKLWDIGGRCLKSIYHPGCIWAVGFLPNSDLVTACSDGVIRIYSEDENRIASEDVRQCFEAAVTARRDELLESRKGTLPPGVKVEDPSILYMPGSKDGETKIVAEGLGASAYAWNAAEGEWKKLGDVLGTQPGELASATKFHDGQEWDYVFDVDFEDGAPMKKLCMNKNDNPHEVAERFLLAENLPQTYLDQVVQFLMNNTQMAESMHQNADPLTGGSAYQPSGSSAPLSANDMGAFAEASLTSMLKFCPMKNYVLFNSLKSTQPIKNKIHEFNEQLKNDTETQNLVLSDDEMAGGLDRLLRAAEEVNAGRKIPLTEEDIALLSKLIQFPPDKIFPVLDICRLLTLEPSFHQTLITWIGSDFDGILAATMTAMGPHQLSMYLLTNALSQPKLRTELSNVFMIALDRFRAAIHSTSKNTRVGYASLVLNLAAQLFMTGKIGIQSTKPQILDIALSILEEVPKDDAETVFRSIVAVGTLLYDDSAVKRYARNTKILSLISAIKSHSGYPTKVIDALKDLDVILK